MRLRVNSLLPLTCCLLAWPGMAWQQAGGAGASKSVRIYVEKFATRADAEPLREDVVNELRKLQSISVAANASDANLILGGGGEVWVKGYRSFSPRSHMKLPTNGEPIYGGYLSVELRNPGGVTVWSYLVTPVASSGDISKELAQRIAKHMAEALSHLEAPHAAPPGNQPAVALAGAGATFPYPVYQKWFTNFQIANPGTAIGYDAVGSEAGIRKLLAGAVDFAGSDSSEAIHDLAPGEESKFLLFPSVIGAVVPIVNLPGIAGEIALTPEALAGIYLGKITKWNDPILKRANPAIALPDLPITVIHRADGSGTSYAWTDYLSKTSPEWKATCGSGLTTEWPAGRAATGNDGVAKMVKEMGGSIGYVEFIYALQNHLSYAKIRNRNGDFVEASLESIASAVIHSPQIRDDFKASIVDAPGEGAYPIASFTWIVVPEHFADAAKGSAMTAFLKWMLGPGQMQAAALGYLALPKEIVAREEAAIGRIR